MAALAKQFCRPSSFRVFKLQNHASSIVKMSTVAEVQEEFQLLHLEGDDKGLLGRKTDFLFQICSLSMLPTIYFTPSYRLNNLQAVQSVPGLLCYHYYSHFISYCQFWTRVKEAVSSHQ